MRLHYLTTNYGAYLDGFYAARADLAEASYDAQRAALDGDFFAWNGSWVRALGPLGYDVFETIGNAEPLQRAWAREHGVPFPADGWIEPLVHAQVRAHGPDVLFVDDYAAYDRAFLGRLRAACPTVRMIVGWCGAPYGAADAFGAYDLLLTNIPDFIPAFRARGVRTEYFCHGFDDAVLRHIDEATAPRVDFSFVGSLHVAPGFHTARESLLRLLVAETDLTIHTAWSPPAAPRRPRSRRRRLWRRLRGRSAAPDAPVDPLAARLRPPVFGLAMYRRMRASSVALNVHIDAAGNHASNMRLFEATGVGTCLLTDWKDNLPSLFEPDVEILTYRTPAEAVERVRAMMVDETARIALAGAGQRRTLRDHTLARRVGPLDAWIRAHLAG